MSFFSKIVENKGALIGVAGIAALVGISLLYKNYKQQEQGGNDQPLIEQEEVQVLDLQAQIIKIRQKINLQNPTLEDIKAVLTFSVEFTKKKILLFSKQFKKRRRQFNKKTRKEKMVEYLNIVANGMEEVQNLGLTLQQEILAKVGITEMHIMTYRGELGPFMQELMMSGMNPMSENEENMTLEQVRNCIQMQINYLKEEGNELIDVVIASVGGWSNQKKATLPTLIAVIVADQVFENSPQIDQQKLQAAELKYQQYLAAQLQELQYVMMPIMNKLAAVIPQQPQFPGMGGMGGGGMGGEGFGQEQMEQLQQLRALQSQDPAAFEEVMRMMQSG